MTDADVARQLMAIERFENQAKRYLATCGEDKAEADQALIVARQAGCLRSVLERWIVLRAKRAQLTRQRIA